jgi:hypothetical protein
MSDADRHVGIGSFSTVSAKLCPHLMSALPQDQPLWKVGQPPRLAGRLTRIHTGKCALSLPTH